MRTFLIRLAPLPLPRRAPWRAPLEAAVVVALLSALFAGAVLAALQPHTPSDALQASVQGGL